MIQRDPLRQWISSNLQPIAFLFAYFATIVAGNLIFASPLGELSLKATGFSPRILEMDQIFTFGYWSLLLCPFVVTPIVVYATRRTAGPLVAQISNIFREFNRTEYLVFLIGCYAVVLYKFWQADVAALFLSGTDALSSVNARFEIHDRIGYWTLMVLQALLPFLSIYSLIRWMRSRERFWLATMVRQRLCDVGAANHAQREVARAAVLHCPRDGSFRPCQTPRPTSRPWPALPSLSWHSC